jgi:hypothetical protein
MHVSRYFFNGKTIGAQPQVCPRGILVWSASMTQRVWVDGNRFDGFPIIVAPINTVMAVMVARNFLPA